MRTLPTALTRSCVDKYLELCREVMQARTQEFPAEGQAEIAVTTNL